ncbi:MAG TPA: chloride channel protein, partial [Anaerolineae bacterium]|nr:chloride channel protein [Anaerolineae bacterium]
MARWLDKVQPPEITVLFTNAAIIGVLTGLVAVFFIWLIDRFHALFFGPVLSLFSPGLGPYAIVLIPALGGLIAGPLISFFAKEAKGHGVPEVMEAIALRGGRMRPIVAGVKAIASSVCIGSGGSAGREGPIVQIGAVLGSVMGQLWRLSDNYIRNLVACGAAAGISAVFNAPIAGVIFALEVILGEFTNRYFGSVVISAVAASIISRRFLGENPAFLVPKYTLVSAPEILFYAFLGILAAVTAKSFVIVLYWFEDVFDDWEFPDWLKPAVGGLLLGALALWMPDVLGAGFPPIEKALDGQLLIPLLLSLLVAKLFGTSLTLGSGNSGGVFAPALFMGAMLGGAFGTLIHGWQPAITAPPGAYALVGMASVFAGAAHAPITAVLIVFEMSGDYRLILPLMTATVISTLLSEQLKRDS